MKYLYEKNNTIYAKCTNCDRVLKFNKYEIDDVSSGVECFCGSSSNIIEGLPSKTSVSHTSLSNDLALQASHPQYRELTNAGQVTDINKPVCPTCGSYRVEKISFTSKAIGGAMWGLFSSDIRNTFRCRSCGYKW